MEITIEIEEDGKGKLLYCPLCRQRGKRVPMKKGKVLIRSSRMVLKPRSLLKTVQRSRLKGVLKLRIISKILERYKHFFYRIYFAPYERVDGYVCENVSSHGLTEATYLKVLLGSVSSTVIADEMREIQDVYRERSIWGGLQ